MFFLCQYFCVLLLYYIVLEFPQNVIIKRIQFCKTPISRFLKGIEWQFYDKGTLISRKDGQGNRSLTMNIYQKQMAYYSEKYAKKQRYERERAIAKAKDLVALVLMRVLEHMTDRKHSIKQIRHALCSYSCSHIDQNYYLFDYRDDVIKTMEQTFDFDFSRKVMPLSEIKKIYNTKNKIDITTSFFKSRKPPRSSVTIYPSNIPENIINTDTDDHSHQSHKKPVHGPALDPPVDPAARKAAQHTASDHQQKYLRLKGRCIPLDQRGQQTGDLGKHDHIDGVQGRLLRLHGKEIEQHNQIDRAAADPQKGGHHPQHNTDTKNDCLIPDMLRGNLFLIDSIKQGTQCDQGQYCCLNRPDPAAVLQVTDHALVEFLSRQAAHDAAQRQHCRKQLIKFKITFIPQILVQRNYRHGKHCTAGKKGYGGDRHDPCRIQHRFDDHPAADAADRSHHR